MHPRNSTPFTYKFTQKMATLSSISHFQQPLLVNCKSKNSISNSHTNPSWSSFRPVTVSSRNQGSFSGVREMTKMPITAAMTSAAEKGERKKRYPGEGKGFVEEMRFVAMKLHTKEQAREGEKVAEGPEEQSPARWEPSVDGYLRFLVDSMVVFGTLEMIVEKAPVDYYAEFRNTGLERTQALSKDLEWFREQGYTIPEPSEPGLTYAMILQELAEKDPQAFICHFYNIYFAHSAGGRMIGKKVAEKILNKAQLEFYKWDGDLSQLLQNVRDKLNKVAESWTREEKNHCLEETEKSFKYSGNILRLIFS